MSLHEYKESQEIDRHGYEFYSLIMAAVRKADDINLNKLAFMFPDLVLEFRDRYNAPGGMLESDQQNDEKGDHL